MQKLYSLIQTLDLLAQNAGVEAAKKYNATHVVFFDQDSVLNEGFISGLLKAERELLLQGENLAAVGPAFYDLQTGDSFPSTVFLGPFNKANFCSKSIHQGIIYYFIWMFSKNVCI